MVLYVKSWALVEVEITSFGLVLMNSFHLAHFSIQSLKKEFCKRSREIFLLEQKSMFYPMKNLCLKLNQPDLGRY